MGCCKNQPCIDCGRALTVDLGYSTVQASWTQNLFCELITMQLLRTLDYLSYRLGFRRGAVTSNKAVPLSSESASHTLPAHCEKYLGVDPMPCDMSTALWQGVWHDLLCKPRGW